MKRLGIIFYVLLCNVALLSAESIDKPVASVRLNESEIISQNQFKKLVILFETNYKRALTLEEKKLLLNKLIDEKLIIQAAKKAYIVVTDSEINATVDKYIQNISRQLNRQVTIEYFIELLKKQGKTLKDFKKEVKNMKLADKYVRKVKKNYFDSVTDPTNGEIEDYYNSNRDKFFSPEMIRFKHIFINLQLLETDQEKKAAKKRAEEIQKKLKNGASFDDYWEIFDEKGQKKIGTMMPAMLRRDDDSSKKIFGTEFINQLFRLKENDISAVLTSNVGYHIILVLEKLPFKTLTLADTIPPQNAMTVRNYIKTYLTQLKQAQILEKAIKEATADLRRNAEIKIWEENLSW